MTITNRAIYEIMQIHYRVTSSRLLLFLFSTMMLLTIPNPISAQSPSEATQLDAPSAPTSTVLEASHPFWDKTNAWLFSAVAASRTFDYFSTLNMRRRGRDEIFLNNDTVDNHAAFAAIEAAATGVSVGASYLFHRYHHHKLERWTSIVHFGLATTGGVRNYSLKTRH